MAEPSREELLRQVAQHLDGLAAGGVEHVPITREPPPRVEATGDLFNAVPLPVAGGPDQRRTELTVLAEAVDKCRRCPELGLRTRSVFGVGPLDADICFLGEAPGADEDRTGEPFVGAAGQLLNKIIAACGYQRSEVFR